MDSEAKTGDDDTKPVRVNIVFDPDAADAVTKSLAAAGLMVEAEYGILGVVTGTAAQSSMDALRSVDGVLAVEADRTDIEAVDESRENPEAPTA